jgi:hypothetical protein
MIMAMTRACISKKGENNCCPVMAMKGEMHTTKETVQMLKGRWTTMMMSSHASYLQAQPGMNLEMSPIYNTLIY